VISIIEEDHEKDDKLITKEPSEEVAVNDDESNKRFFDVIDCPIIKF